MPEQFTDLSDLVEDIKATGDSAIAAIACRALNDVLRQYADWQEIEV
jgi:hypothetical protein